jgi:putative acetyltransferase
LYKINFLKTNSDQKDFLTLVKELDADLAIRDGDDHPFYAEFNKVDSIKNILVAYVNSLPVGCGTIKEYDANTMEVKRMYVPLAFRGKGIASLILKELEYWAKELNYKKCILETGYLQHEAIALYKKNNYQIINNYGQYTGIENSICFEKKL